MHRFILAIALVLLFAVSAFAAPLTLRWTAPADDVGLATEGPVTAYKVVYSEAPITAANFDAATVLTTGTPKAPGQNEAYAYDLPTGKVYYMAIKSVDEAGNWSPISNVISVDFTVPNPITDFRFTLP